MLLFLALKTLRRSPPEPRVVHDDSDRQARREEASNAWSEFIRRVTPVVPTPPPKPTVLCVNKFFNKLNKGDRRSGPIVLCNECSKNLQLIQRSWYSSKSSHFLLIARVSVNLECHKCGESIAITRPITECDRCSATYSQLREILRRRGRGLNFLDDVVRIPQYQVPRPLHEILPYLADRPITDHSV